MKFLLFKQNPRALCPWCLSSHSSIMCNYQHNYLHFNHKCTYRNNVLGIWIMLVNYLEYWRMNLLEWHAKLIIFFKLYARLLSFTIGYYTKIKSYSNIDNEVFKLFSCFQMAWNIITYWLNQVTEFLHTLTILIWLLLV